MTLSARIALRPSGRLAFLETFFPVAGIAVAAVSLAARWPSDALPIGVATAVVAVSFAIVFRRRWNGLRTLEVVVSHHEEIGVAGSDEPWCLAEPSLVRPGFAVLAIRRMHGPRSRPVVRAVLDADLAAVDRRALHRFLCWCRQRRPGPGPNPHSGAP